MPAASYPPERFQPSGYDSGTPERKARFVNELLRFLAADCPRERFTKRLYLGLSNHGYFGFIAHYDIDGFYDAQLATPERRRSFLETLARRSRHDARLDRPDIWSDVKAVLAQRLPAPAVPERAPRLSPFTVVGRLTAQVDGDRVTLF